KIREGRPMTLRVRMRRVRMLLPAAGLCIVAALAPFSALADTGDTAVATEQVYVRSGPSTDDAILGNLHAGDTVELTGATSNGFDEIWYGDYIGYAYGDYISPAESTSDTQAQAA